MSLLQHQIGLQVTLFLDLLKLVLMGKYFADLFFIVENSTKSPEFKNEWN
jgi:hypothetical protein